MVMTDGRVGDKVDLHSFQDGLVAASIPKGDGIPQVQYEKPRPVEKDQFIEMYYLRRWHQSGL